MKEITMFEDINGGKHDTAQLAAEQDRIIKMRNLSNHLIAEWTKSQYGWMPEVGDLSIILQRLAKSKGFGVIRKVQNIQREAARYYQQPEQKDDIPF